MFISNLNYLMHLKGNMSKTTLARLLNVSTDHLEMWYNGNEPSINDVLKLSELFKVGMEQLLTSNLVPDSNIFSDVVIDVKKGFRYLPYTVISRSPVQDAQTTVENLSKTKGFEPVAIIGWEFQQLSLDQKSLFGMSGYTAAAVIADDHNEVVEGEKLQESMKYASITITMDHREPSMISKAYSIIQRTIDINALDHEYYYDEIQSFEYAYEKNGKRYFDVSVALNKNTLI